MHATRGEVCGLVGPTLSGFDDTGFDDTGINDADTAWFDVGALLNEFIIDFFQ